MADDMRLLFYYVLALGFAIQFGLLFLQIRTFARTRHGSLALLAIGTAIGVIYLAVCSVANVVAVPDVYHKPINYIGAFLLTVYGILSLWGVASLFRAFQVAFANHQPGNDGA
jgi:hypothetical protein